jgi:catechol 2,3-dioxygenase-like lactoylglutathione lyase family enzyme
MIQLGRIILYVQDAERLSAFYREAFAFPLVQHIPGEWVVLRAGECELALFQVGPQYRAPPGGWRGDNNNAKLVFTIDKPIAEMRNALIAQGVAMGEIKQYPGFTGPLCDGRDPEGNVFQLSEPAI